MMLLPEKSQVRRYIFLRFLHASLLRLRQAGQSVGVGIGYLSPANTGDAFSRNSKSRSRISKCSEQCLHAFVSMMLFSICGREMLNTLILPIRRGKQIFERKSSRGQTVCGNTPESENAKTLAESHSIDFSQLLCKVFLFVGSFRQHP